MSGVGAEGGGDVEGPVATQEGDGRVAEGGHGLGCGAAADRAAILVESDVPHPMQTVLDPPMSPRQSQQPPRSRLVRRETGDQIVRLLRRAPPPVHAGDQPGHLGQVRPLGPLIERRRSRQFADLVPITVLVPLAHRS